MEEILVKWPRSLSLQLLKYSYLLVVQMGSFLKENVSILRITDRIHIICTHLSVERESTLPFPQWALTHIPVYSFFLLGSRAQGHLHCKSAGSTSQGWFCLTTSYWLAEGSHTPSLGCECLWVSTLPSWALGFLLTLFGCIRQFPLPEAGPSLRRLWLLAQSVTCLHALIRVLSNIQMKIKPNHF